MLKFIHCADLHIGAPCLGLSGNKAEARSNEIREALTLIVDFCIEKEADILLICGDLFDTPTPSLPTASFVREELSRIPDTEIFIVCGNHDYLCRGGIFEKMNAFPANVHIFPAFFKCFEFPEKGFRVSGVSFSSSTAVPALIPAFQDSSLINILCLHGDITPKSSYNIITEECLMSSRADYAAFGHIHDGHMFRCGNVQCAYSGTPEGHKFNDDGNTGFIYGEFSENGLSTQSICLTKRKYIRFQLNISDLQMNNRIINEIEEIISPENLYKIDLTGFVSPQSDFSMHYIQTRLRAGAFSLSLSDKTLPLEDITTLENEESLRGYFVRYLRTLCDDASLTDDAIRIGLNALSGRETEI